MKKFALKATVAAAGLLVSGLSFADVNMDAPGAQTDAIFASEIVLASAGEVIGVTDASKLTADVTVGLASAEEIYVRFDLDNGTFAGIPTFKTAEKTASASAIIGTGTVSQGGKDNNYVIFAVKATDSATTPVAAALKADDIGTFKAVGGVKVANKNGVKLSYSLYETLTAAVNKTPNTALKAKENIEFIKFAPALEVKTTNETATADVSAKDLPYSKFVGDLATAGIGKVTVAYTSRLLASGAAPTDETDFLGNTNAITITGDFSWASGVTIGGTAAVIAADKQSATLGGASATPAAIAASTLATAAPGTALPFVVTAAKDTAIPETSFTSKVSFAAKTGYAVADAAGGSGEVVRNGTVLKFPALSQGKNTTTFLQLVNTSALAAPMTTVCYLNDGSNVAGLSTTVAANTTYRNTLDKVCPTDTAKVQSAVLTLAVPSGNVNGTLMRKESTTGVMTYVNAASGN